jgi:hypothetical protein
MTTQAAAPEAGAPAEADERLEARAAAPDPYPSRDRPRGTYLFFGLLGPVTAEYLQDIVDRFQSGIQVILADATPKEGIANSYSQPPPFN